MPILDLLATIFALVVLIKIIIVLVSPEFHIKFATKLLDNKHLLYLVYIIAIVLVGYYLLQEIPLVTIAAILLFAFLIIGLALIPLYDSVIASIEEHFQSRNHVIKKFALTIIIFLILAIWTLYTIYYPT
tara:strand:+ start:8264 stop:8653 length:390 start_codon:yes stop_codon:yes gene_type:complete